MRTEALKRGEVIVKELEFPRVRHSDFLEDPDFKEVLAEAKLKDRKWTKIWFYDTARVSRNRLKAQTTKMFFKRTGIEIEFLKLPKTGEESLDNLIEGILETFDQLLSDFARAGAIRGQKQNIRSGYRAGGRAPYGYHLKKHKLGINVDNHEIKKSTLEPHPVHFPIVKEYLERRGMGESRTSIIRDFARREIKSPSGNAHWQSSTCRSIEENLLVYCGHLVYNRHNRMIDGNYVGGEKFRSEDEWEIYRDAHKPAITEEQAEAIRTQLIKRTTASPKSRKYLLNGLLRCAICNGPMVGDSGYYSCIHKRNHQSECTNSKMSSTYLDKQMIKFVKETLLSRTHFEKVIEATKKAYQEEIRKTKKDTTRLQKRIIEIDESINRNMSLFERGNIAPDIIERRIGELEQEKENINKTLEGDHQVLTAIQYAESELNDRTIKSYIDRFEELLNETNIELIRNFLHTFIAKIELYGRDNGKRKGRRLNIHGQIPTLTGIYYASPGGIEPPL